MRNVLAVMILGVALASAAPAAWASDKVDYSSYPAADQPAVVAAAASDGAVAGSGAEPTPPYAELRQENVEH